MKIYLDIDGVLLTKNGEPAVGVLEFLKKVTEHDCYWLTTHCKDDSVEGVQFHLKQKLPQEAFEYIKKIKPNPWGTLKTEGLDFSSEFMWFDDTLFQSEEAVLRQHNALNAFRLVDLRKYPDQLLQELI